MYYLIVESPVYNFEGYVNSTLAVFETSDWGDPSNTTSKEIRESRDAGFTQPDTYLLLAFPDYFGPDPEVVGNDTYAVCRYKSYRWEIKVNLSSDRFHELTLWFAHRNPPGGPEAYEFGLRWMHVKASQLLFVAIYEVISGAYCEVL